MPSDWLAWHRRPGLGTRAGGEHEFDGEMGGRRVVDREPLSRRLMVFGCSISKSSFHGHAIGPRSILGDGRCFGLPPSHPCRYHQPRVFLPQKSRPSAKIQRRPAVATTASRPMPSLKPARASMA
jgi:hypothetical protein